MNAGGKPLPNLSLFKISEAILAQAKDLLGGDSHEAAPRHENTSSAAGPDAEGERDLTTLDETFWTHLVGDDRRLAELRRAIDEAAAEAMSGKTQGEASLDPKPQLGESRWEAANRRITDALKAEKP